MDAQVAERAPVNVEMDASPIIDGIMATYGTRYGLTAYRRSPPDADLDPIVIDEVHAEPVGGRKTLPRSLVWCSECEQPKFWDGLAITDGVGGLYLIGETCGVRFYGGDRLQSARRTWRAKREHDRALERFLSAKALVPRLLDAVALAQSGYGIADLDEHRRRLRAFSSELNLRLSSNLLANDNVIIVSDPATDTQGKTFLVKRRLGRIKGVSLFHKIGTETKAIVNLESAAYAMNALAHPDRATPTALAERTIALRDAIRHVDILWAEAQQAHRFFRQDNLDRVVAFADVECPSIRVLVSESRLRMGERQLDPFDPLNLPELGLPRDE